MKADAEEVVGLAFVPVGAGKDLGDGLHSGLSPRNAGADDGAQRLLSDEKS